MRMKQIKVSELPNYIGQRVQMTRRVRKKITKEWFTLLDAVLDDKGFVDAKILRDGFGMVRVSFNAHDEHVKMTDVLKVELLRGEK